MYSSGTYLTTARTSFNISCETTPECLESAGSLTYCYNGLCACVIGAAIQGDVCKLLDICELVRSKYGKLMLKVAFSLFSTINQSACSTLRLTVEQPIRFRLSVVHVPLGISNTIEDNSNVNISYYNYNNVHIELPSVLHRLQQCLICLFSSGKSCKPCYL